MTQAIDETEHQPAKARHVECTLETYHARTEWSRSQLEDCFGDKGSPALFHGRYIADPPIYPRKAKKEFDIGTVAHAVLSSPGGIDSVVVVIPENVLADGRKRQGNKYKQWKSEHKGLIDLKEEEIEAIRHMVRNVYEHPYGAWLMAHTLHFEFSLVYECPETGLSLRARPDLLCSHRGGVLVVDFKTTKALRPRQWRSDAASYGYHRQAAWYCEAVELFGYPVNGFLAITVDKSPAHECRIYQFPDHGLEQGRKENHENRRELARRLDENDWTDPLGKDVMVVDLPQWAYDEKEGIVA